MTTLIFLGDSVPLPGVPDCTAQLVDYHVSATGARFADELNGRLQNFAPVKLTKTIDAAEYAAVIAGLDSSHPVWSIRDDRVLFFLAEFAGMVKDARLVWLDGEPQELNRLAFEKFKGPKLRLEKIDVAAVMAFVGE